MTNLRTRLTQLEAASGQTGLLLISWQLDGEGKLTACGLTQADEESREQFLTRVAAGRTGVVWVDEVDARL